MPVTREDDVVRIVRVERERPGLFEPVARAGLQFAEEYLTRDAITRYTADLLRMYSQILTDHPTGTIASAAGIQVHARLRNRGDIGGFAAAGVGTRGSDEVIEGFALFPYGLIDAGELSYSAVLDDGTLSPWVSSGEFCGSPEPSRPLFGFAVRLQGVTSERFACAIAASFTDGTKLERSSDRGVCVAPSRAPLRWTQVVLLPRAPAAAGMGCDA